MLCIGPFTSIDRSASFALAPSPLDRNEGDQEKMWSMGLPLDSLGAPLANPAVMLVLDGCAELWPR